MGEPRFVYVPRQDATPEGELGALVAVYRYILQRYERTKITEKLDGGDDEVTAEDERAETMQRKA